MTLEEKKKALTLKSAWITKNGSHISPPSDVQAPNQTPNSELSMNTDPSNSIPQNSDSVNSKFSISEESPSEDHFEAAVRRMRERQAAEKTEQLRRPW